MRIQKPGDVGNLRNQNISNIEPSELREHSFMFMKNIRGTVAYWADILNDLLATVKCLGPPTLFVTLSADDNHWPVYAHTIFILLDISSWLCWYLIRVFLNVRSFSI